MNIRTPFLAALLVLACGSVTAGEPYKQFPGAPFDERTLRTQERAEELYERGEYARALMICEKDLAPRGDKYAQYTIGYMYLAGQGVPIDKARALAWYRLAAERGSPPLVQARDELFRQLRPAEIAESNRIFAELWKKMGDNRILLELIRQDMKTLAARTGSRIPGAASSPLTVIDMTGSGIADNTFYDTIEDRIRTRLAYLRSNVEIIDIDLGDNDNLVRSLEDDTKEALASLDSP